jgi:MurNAc alpha-1-phosphate uridylyltransferase
MKAMILAAGRGERMRPLTDRHPKPLLEAGGKPLIVWNIERLVTAGFTDIVINHAWLGEQFPERLGDGSRWGARIAYSAEGTALETAGGIVKARPLLGEGVMLVISGDIYCDFPFATLRERARQMAAAPQPRMHLVMVPNPDFHPRGDFALRDGHLHADGEPRLTFGNIGLYDSRSFDGLQPGIRLAMGPLYHRAIAEGRASGERFDGTWLNIGTPDQLAALDRRLREAGPSGTRAPA